MHLSDFVSKFVAFFRRIACFLYFQLVILIC